MWVLITVRCSHEVPKSNAGNVSSHGSGSSGYYMKMMDIFKDLYIYVAFIKLHGLGVYDK